MTKDRLFKSKKSTHYIFPTPIQDLVMDYLDSDIALKTSSLYDAHQTCTLFEGGSKENAYDKLAFTALLGHVIRGEQDQAEAIIRTYPELVFKSGTVKDLSGNTFIDYSPSQLACYAHDENMIKMMKSYLDDKGKIEFNKNLSEANQAYEAQEPYDFSALVAVIEGGSVMQKQKALAEFKKQFEPREIKNEKSFNIKTLEHAYYIYEKNYYPWIVEQCSLFWCEIIGYYQRLLPAGYAQALCQGLYHVTEGQEPLSRILELSDGEPFYQRDLGFEYAVISNLTSSKDDCCRKQVSHPDGWHRVWESGKSLSMLIKQKHQACKNLCNDDEIEQKITALNKM